MMTAERTATFFDGYARDFDAIYGTKNGPVNDVVNRLFRKSMKDRYQLTVMACDPIQGKTVLDIGCGPGHYSLELAKRGAARVLGIDFADGMLDIAREGAKRANLQNISFERQDFLQSSYPEGFDYSIVMGFMDYIQDARSMVEKALDVTRSKVLFSFPLAGGLLAFQRRIRYRFRCELFLYTESQVRALFPSRGVQVDTVNLGRDLFVAAKKL